MNYNHVHLKLLQPRKMLRRAGVHPRALSLTVVLQCNELLSPLGQKEFPFPGFTAPSHEFVCTPKPFFSLLPFLPLSFLPWLRTNALNWGFLSSHYPACHYHAYPSLHQWQKKSNCSALKEARASMAVAREESLTQTPALGGVRPRAQEEPGAGFWSPKKCRVKKNV